MVRTASAASAHVMALMIGELYDALRAGGVDSDLARRAAEAVYHDRHQPRRTMDNYWLGLVVAEAIVIFVLIGLLARSQ
jgi:hypothetical protein